MTEGEKLLKVKSMLTNEYDDSILLDSLGMAAAEVLRTAYPFDPTKTDVPHEYEWHQIRIAAYFVSRRGALSQTTHSENGIQRQWENGDVPASLLRGITPHVGVWH